MTIAFGSLLKRWPAIQEAVLKAQIKWPFWHIVESQLTNQDLPSLAIVESDALLLLSHLGIDGTIHLAHQSQPVAFAIKSSTPKP